ncbi:MAG: peptide-methionine (R)-S-oxide reductase, partial [Haliea sp.]|nr:peptide-methionine (R)-S-oxide reductase [Haliea sp.]
MLTWNEICRLANEGNPEPDTRLQRSNEEWAALLTPEQYHV